MADEIKCPVIIGMPRSASRLTWQIVKHLIPPKEEVLSKNGYHVLFDEGADGTMREHIGGEAPPHWPIRCHCYAAGPPAIYTYRNPAEAMLSLRHKYVYDVGKEGVHPEYNRIEATNDAQAEIGSHQRIFQRLQSDAGVHGYLGFGPTRPVLFLRYEDYFNDNRQRIIDIAEFINVSITEEKIKSILEDTSLKKNHARGEAIAAENPQMPFKKWEGPNGMQPHHVSAETSGVPGAWIRRHPGFWQAVVNGDGGPSMEALRDMCIQLGYEVSLKSFREREATPTFMDFGDGQ